MAVVHLSKGSVQPVWAGHPWVFARAIAKVAGKPEAGDIVDVADAHGNFVGRGHYSPSSAIAVRLLSRREGERVEDAMVRAIDRAARLRTDTLGLAGVGRRMINAEGDGLPGLVVDVYGEVAVAQLGTVGMARTAPSLFDEILRASGARSLVIAAVDAEKTEGFTLEESLARGPAPSALEFIDRGFSWTIAREVGQKTGYYFDQRDNRALFETLAAGKRVLDAYSFVGAFARAALRGGASEALSIDSSAAAIAVAEAMATRDGTNDRHRTLVADVKKALPALADAGEHFDLVIVDPPKLAPTTRHLDKARRAYRKIAANAAALTSEDGIMVMCSCSAALETSELLRLVALGAAEVGRTVDVLHVGGQAPDHPYPAGFPQGRYLDVVFARVSER